MQLICLSNVWLVRLLNCKIAPDDEMAIFVQAMLLLLAQDYQALFLGLHEQESEVNIPKSYFEKVNGHKGKIRNVQTDMDPA